MISKTKKSEGASRYAVVVLSHSSYSDLWNLLIQSYEINFCSNRFDFYLATDPSDVPISSFFRKILYPSGLSWGVSFKYILKELNYEYVIFTFDDLILYSKVNENLLISSIDNEKSDYYKLTCSHIRFYERFFKFGGVFNLKQEDSYRGSLVFACLNRKFIEYLKKQNLEYMNPWTYERDISSLIPGSFKQIGSRKNLFHFRNLVIKGKINPVAKLLCGFSGLTYEGDRVSMSIGSFGSFYFKLLAFTIIKYFLPYSLFNYIRRNKRKFSLSSFRSKSFS